MLDVRHAGLASRQRDPPTPSPGPSYFSRPPLSHRASGTPRRSALGLSADDEETLTPRMYAVDLPPAGEPRPRLSLQDMIATALVLQSGRDVEVAGLVPGAAAAVFAPFGAGATARMPPLDRLAQQANTIPTHVAQALAGLQRDVLLLRNELNLELWLNRENVKHIGRLYEVFNTT
jgi:hypothetical protein